jgi:hypothetical protein
MKRLPDAKQQVELEPGTLWRKGGVRLDLEHVRVDPPRLTLATPKEVSQFVCPASDR